jgi:hypothetical protein
MPKVKTYVPCGNPHPKNNGDYINLYCILPKGHKGKHYDGGVSIGVEWENEEGE